MVLKAEMKQETGKKHFSSTDENNRMYTCEKCECIFENIDVLKEHILEHDRCTKQVDAEGLNKVRIKNKKRSSSTDESKVIYTH